MAKITKEQLDTIIKNAPTGTSRAGIISALRQKGHTIQDLDNEIGKDEGVGGVGGFGVGVVKSAGELFKGTASLLQGAGQRVIAGATPLSLEEVREKTGVSAFEKGTEEEQKLSEQLERKGTAEKVGGFVGDVASFAIPGAGVTKATKGLNFVQRLASRAGTAGTVGAMKEGEVGKEALIAGGTEAVLPVVGTALKPVLSYGKSVMKGLAGFVTGAGEDVIERAFASPTVAREGMKATDEAGLRQTATAVRQGVKTLREKAGKEYEALTSKVTQILDGNALKQKVNSIFADTADATVSKGGVTFKNTPLLEAEERQLVKVNNLIQGWTDTSAKGLNTLATKISKFRRGTQDSSNFDRIIDDVRRGVRNFVGEQVPEIAEANTKFADKMDMIENLEAILKTKGAVDSSRGIRETSQKVAQLFNANKDLAREAVDELEKEIGVDTLALEAGRQLSDATTKFQVGAGGVVENVLRTALKKPIAELVTRTGQSKQAIEQVLAGKINALDATARGTLIDVLNDLFGGEQTEQDQEEKLQ